MTRFAPGLFALATFSATQGMAGGIDRGALDYNILFETGRTAAFSLKAVTPAVKGGYIAAFGGGSTGNMAQSFTNLSFGFKDDINEKLSYAIVIGQPFGADAKYTAGAYKGLEAHWNTIETTALLKYRLGGGASVFGGLRYLNSSADIIIPNLLMGGTGIYTAKASNDGRFGYVLGAAYEKPEIALRVALTYTSAVTHKFATTEKSVVVGGTLNSVTDITLPQSLTLDAQTGIAKDTLLFGSVRWAEWSKWHVKPKGFSALPAPLGGEITGFDHDVVTYTLGLGRKLTDHLSIFGSLGYEASTGGISSRLSPTDGYQSIGLGVIFTQDRIKITAGVQYVKFGSAVDSTGTKFSGNSATGFGVKIGYTF